ncbi:hypothetical protein LXL04_015075 [Taraxacum kok-saghyz]
MCFPFIGLGFSFVCMSVKCLMGFLGVLYTDWYVFLVCSKWCFLNSKCRISGETTSPTENSGSFSDLMNLANVSLYRFEDYHGLDIGVVRRVRLWFAPLGGEVAVEIKIKDGDSKLGFAITRIQEVQILPLLLGCI